MWASIYFICRDFEIFVFLFIEIRLLQKRVQWKKWQKRWFEKVWKIVRFLRWYQEYCPWTKFVCFNRLCRLKKKAPAEANATAISNLLPFMEYEVHTQLMNKLKLKGMNALFGLRIQITVGENMLMGLAVSLYVVFVFCDSCICSGFCLMWFKESFKKAYLKKLTSRPLRGGDITRSKKSGDRLPNIFRCKNYIYYYLKWNEMKWLYKIICNYIINILLYSNHIFSSQIPKNYYG